MPNAWDAGSAKLFASLGFPAIATTSSGFAATLGRADGGVSRDEAIAHTAALAAATPLPVNADLEDCFADDPAGVAATITAAGGGRCGRRVGRGLHARRVAGRSTTSAWPPSGSPPPPRRRRASGLVLTARAENLIRGVRDLDDTIRRLQAYQEAGADVLYAPGLFDDRRRPRGRRRRRPAGQRAAARRRAGRARRWPRPASPASPSAGRWPGCRGAPSPTPPASCWPIAAPTATTDLAASRRQGGAAAALA